MKLSVTSWSFPQCSLKECIGISKLLSINAIDIGYFYKSSIDKKKLLEDHKNIINKLNKYENLILNTEKFNYKSVIEQRRFRKNIDFNSCHS